MALEGGGSGGSARGIRAGAAFVELSVKDGMSDHLKRIAGKFAQFGKSVLAATGIGGLIGGAIGGMSFKESADDLTKMRSAIKAMGMSATGGSGLFGVLNQFSDIGENVEGLTQFAQKVQDAFNGIGEEPKKLFEGLSVSAKDIIDLPLDQKFLAIHEAIRQLPQEQQQFKLSLIGGTDSMKKWIPLLDMSNAELREQAKNLAFGSAELDDAAAASKAMATAGGQVNRVWQQMVIMLAPLVTQGAKLVSDYLQPVVEWSKGRTLGDIWEEIVARVKVGWEELKQMGRVGLRDLMMSVVTFVVTLPGTIKQGWDSLWGGMVTGFATAVIQVGAIFSGLLESMKNEALKLFTQIAVAAANPLEAAKLLALAPLAPLALGAAGIDMAIKKAGPEIAKLAVAGAVELEGMKKAALDAIDVAKGQAELDAARENLNRVLAQIEANRAGRRGDGADVLPPAVRDGLNRAGRAFGTFGAGSFLTQGFSLQSAEDVGKKLDKGNKLAAEGNEHLAEIKKKVGPQKFK